MIDTVRIEALARVLDNTPVMELVVAEAGTEIRFSRIPMAAQPQDEPGVPPAATEAEVVPHEHAVVARRVGVYHRPPRPVHPGDPINAGEIVGYVEAMRILHEVVCEKSGVLTQVFVEDCSPVEYGQELMLLRETIENEINRS